MISRVHKELPGCKRSEAEEYSTPESLTGQEFEHAPADTKGGNRLPDPERGEEWIMQIKEVQHKISPTWTARASATDSTAASASASAISPSYPPTGGGAPSCTAFTKAAISAA